MAKTKSTVIDFTKIMNNILTDYGDEVRQEAAEVLTDLSDKVVTEIKSKSPRGEGTQHYADGWTAERAKDKFGTDRVVVFNQTKPTLTHLLENGHRGYPLKNGGRTRDVPGKKHISPTQKWAEKEAMKELERRLKG